MLTQSEHPPRPSGPREGRLARHTGPTALMAAAAATTAALATVPGPVPLLIVLAVAAGTVSDNITLLPATAVTDCWETAHYARLSILLAATATGSHRTRSSQCASHCSAGSGSMLPPVTSWRAFIQGTRSVGHRSVHRGRGLRGRHGLQRPDGLAHTALSWALWTTKRTHVRIRSAATVPEPHGRRRARCTRSE